VHVRSNIKDDFPLNQINNVRTPVAEGRAPLLEVRFRYKTNTSSS
jgi:hypothetical protein